MRTGQEIAENIRRCRSEGELDLALEYAYDGIEKFSESDFFYKIAGDLLWEKQEYLGSGEKYVLFLTKINNQMQYFKNFAKFWKKFSGKASLEEKKMIYQKIVDEFNKNFFSSDLKRELASVLYNTFPEENREFLKIGNSQRDVKKWIQENEKKEWDIYRMLYWEANFADHTPATAQKDKYLVSVMEKKEIYALALDLLSKVLCYSDDDVSIRTLFRLCRKMEDYGKADEYLQSHPEMEGRKGFNIQYELVYYYLEKNDEPLLLKTLRNIRGSASSSIPISRTLQNFYVKLGMIDEAVEMRKHIDRLVRESKKGIEGQTSREVKGIEEERETDDVFWDTIKDMVSEQEHNRQLIAIKELLRGFSHELGQPITNIRYGVQLFQMKMERDQATTENLQELLHTILDQTVRVGKLLNRFAPIVSSKGKNTEFNCIENIRNVFRDMKSRLDLGGINFSIDGIDCFMIYGDGIQFDQVFYNLISNSVDELRKKDGEKEIKVKCSIEKKALKISFADNGRGIPKENVNKIFNPFYSTKDKKESDGGEGLGLYIVWNILKMYGGKIRVNSRSKQMGGAEFLITIPKGGTGIVQDTNH